MTTVPLMSSMLSWTRIASVAAWSAARSSPRPISRAAAMAAASETRASPRLSMRSWKENWSSAVAMKSLHHSGRARGASSPGL
jgi:hypothetical protein